MTGVLNGPLEVGLRILMILTEAHPDCLDLSRLTLLDYALLHSADFDGPTSVSPAAPIRSGELGMKRRAIESGLEVIIRANLAHASVDSDGVQFQADDGASVFLSLLESSHAASLHARARWAIDKFGTLDAPALRLAFTGIMTRWSDEFTASESFENGGA